MPGKLSKILKRDDGVLIPLFRKFLYNADIAAHQGNADRDQVKITCMEFQIKLMQAVVEQFKNSRTRAHDTGKLHPSSLYGCARAIWFRAFGFPLNPPISSDDSLRKYFIFSLGDSIHYQVQCLCHAMGILEDAEVAVESEKYDIEGHCDGILCLDGKRYVLEIKSTNSRYFGQIDKSGKPLTGHKEQLHNYMDVLGIGHGIILYENKDTQALKEFVYDTDKRVVATNHQLCTQLQRAIQTKKAPSREGTSPGCDVCKWCKFTQVCFSDEKFKLYYKRLVKGLDHASKAPQRKKSRGLTVGNKATRSTKRAKAGLTIARRSISR